MNESLVILLFSSISFFIFGTGCLVSKRMRAEFVRYGLGKLRVMTGVLELAGALGLLVGILFPPIALLASFGLFLLMTLGFLVRMKIGDTLLQSLPAIAYALINLRLFLLLLSSLRSN